MPAWLPIVRDHLDSKVPAGLGAAELPPASHRAPKATGGAWCWAGLRSTTQDPCTTAGLGVCPWGRGRAVLCWWQWLCTPSPNPVLPLLLRYV